jgi:hypothetical protein
VYFAYADETGNDDVSPVLVMVGIVVDASRLGRTQRQFDDIFRNLADLTGRPLRELKSSDVLPGKGTWRDVEGETRRNVVSNLCQWVSDRKHRLAVAALHREGFKANQPPCAELQDEWQAAACHLCLQVQRAHQSKSGGKGRTVLVFDENKRGVDLLANLVYAPPSWTDDYYGRGKKQDALDQIVDTPFAAKSHHVGLVQVADVLAGVLRRYASLTDYGWDENYEGELGHYREWVDLMAPSLLGREHRWAKNNQSECAQWYRSLAPPSLLEALGYTASGT